MALLLVARRSRPLARRATRDMHLTPREIDHLQLHQVGALAQRRLARGLKLNQPEAASARRGTTKRLASCHAVALGRVSRGRGD
mmetsp:Transcript_13753/g.42582  ORF Transcript_13753/g.42582 Transcript_13753/m.42582 type:complete len:84 (-) Transcript_13753:869-1120(-)